MLNIDKAVFYELVDQLIRVGRALPSRPSYREPLEGLFGMELTEDGLEVAGLEALKGIAEELLASKQQVVTLKHLMQIGVRPTLAEGYTAYLNQYLKMFDIVTPLRLSHFFAQALYQTSYMHELTERSPEPFRKRGLLGLAGKASYERFGVFCGEALLDNPKLVSKPKLSVLSACWQWAKADCNVLADADDLIAVTRLIAANSVGLAKRRKLLADCKLVF